MSLCKPPVQYWSHWYDLIDWLYSFIARPIIILKGLSPKIITAEQNQPLQFFSGCCFYRPLLLNIERPCSIRTFAMWIIPAEYCEIRLINHGIWNENWPGSFAQGQCWFCCEILANLIKFLGCWIWSPEWSCCWLLQGYCHIEWCIELWMMCR